MKTTRFSKFGIQRELCLGLSILLLGACAGKGKAKINSPITATNSCYMYGSNLTGSQAEQCCASGVPKSEPPSGCPTAPGFVAAKSAIQGFAADAQAGRAALSAADSMVGNSRSNGLGAQSAATEGVKHSAAPLMTSPESAARQQDGKGQLPLGLGSGGSEKSGGGGGASASGAGGGLPSGFGSGVTTAAVPKSLDQPVAAPGEVGAAYTGGGGAAGSRGGSGGADFGSLLGGASAGVGGGSQDALALGRNPATGAIMGSVDPENYFSILKPSDSLFKVVERRYTDKAKGWALIQVNDAKASLKNISR